jgi:hypothetical protein
MLWDKKTTEEETMCLLAQMNDAIRRLADTLATAFSIEGCHKGGKLRLDKQAPQRRA